MSIEKYVDNKRVWYHDKEQLVEQIVDELDNKRLVKTYEQKCEVRDAVSEILNDYTLYHCYENKSKSAITWRLLYVLLFVFQWLLLPYCFFQWLKTGRFKLDGKSRTGMIIARIIENSR
ncbi:hypothetical protein PPW95_25320 (plasmid) [Vibrio parahaemolyticus]|uniref:hypothetical protein n=1 Tax=Vibrio harveyi group TaxID=717610 RepID=UPI000971775A|nr:MULTISPECIES: hypothetical protein [Vibrio harveyi group]APX10058.1 hypothetical protein BWP24_28120 [Vibrio campbellii]WCP78932.1 hypothetical protein PPW95_25320 [Vibrio parahaemolyticus]